MLLKESCKSGFPDVCDKFYGILTMILSETIELRNYERPIQKRYLSRT